MATSNITTQPFIADAKSITRINGATIDWTAVTEVDADGNKMVSAGTIMSRETDGFTPAVDAATAVTAILEATAYGHEQSQDSLSGYGMIVGGVIYDNLLPDAAEVNFATWKTALEAIGTGFSWQTYGDSRDTS